MSKLTDGNHPFVRRCTAALTHPVTVGALGLLLLNDLVFKALWSNPWTTGKLSDLAWVVFASPLLAFLLSPIARGSRTAERIVFVTAYAGLPVLYAAFNTFPVVHDVILWALSFAGGTGPGAPHDPTDSLVIPFGLAIAVWVWRRDPPVSNSLRMRFGLLTAGVAALASVATSPIEPEAGVTAVEVEPDGKIVAVRDESAAKSVETPRGTYSIEGSSIMRTHNGERAVAYSARYLREPGNINLQRHVTRDLGPREITTEPYSIIYDERSGNVVVAMGLQGAVVGTPDGQWNRVAVGSFAPTDFSIVTKVLLLREWELWLVALALAFSFTALAMALAEPGSYRLVKTVIVVVGTIAAVVAGAAIPFLAFVSIPLVIVPLAIIAWTSSNTTNPWQKTSHLILAVFAVLASLGGTLYYSVGSGLDSGAAAFLSASGAGVGLILALCAVVISYGDLTWALSASTGTGSSSFTTSEIRKGLLPAIAASVFGMLALISFSFLLWVQAGIELIAAKVSAIILVALVAFILHWLVARMVRRNPLH
ncbi:MAG: hypothetical protein OXD46_15685 [Chloroflexi bacterium]|nr:hypothetical protein [Chloroflexota bacterium]